MIHNNESSLSRLIKLCNDDRLLFCSINDLKGGAHQHFREEKGFCIFINCLEGLILHEQLFYQVLLSENLIMARIHSQETIDYLKEYLGHSSFQLHLFGEKRSRLTFFHSHNNDWIKRRYGWKKNQGSDVQLICSYGDSELLKVGGGEGIFFDSRLKLDHRFLMKCLAHKKWEDRSLEIVGNIQFPITCSWWKRLISWLSDYSIQWQYGNSLL